MAYYRSNDQRYGAANPWFQREHQAAKQKTKQKQEQKSETDPAFPLSRVAVESRPKGVSVSQARKSFLESKRNSGSGMKFQFLFT